MRIAKLDANKEQHGMTAQTEPPFSRAKKLPKTLEEVEYAPGRGPAAKRAATRAEIAYLDKLRTCEGEAMPVGLPLACVVKVVAYEEIPKACEQYAMATVEGRDGHGGCAFADTTSKRECGRCSSRMTRFCRRAIDSDL